FGIVFPHHYADRAHGGALGAAANGVKGALREQGVGKASLRDPRSAPGDGFQYCNFGPIGAILPPLPDGERCLWPRPPLSRKETKARASCRAPTCRSLAGGRRVRPPPSPRAVSVRR